MAVHVNLAMPETTSCSVILATRNRAESLRETLAALARQQTQGAFTYEVLVVDNGSTDATSQVVQALHATFPVPLRYAYEGRQGKPFALNTGLQDARGQYVAFTDDDVLPTPTWLTALWRCFHEEQADGVTGRVLPRWTAPRPAWLTDQLVMRVGVLGCVDHGPHRLSSRDQHDCRWVGGNLAIGRTTAQWVGAFDIRLRGISPRAEDTVYYEQCIRRGLKIIYEPAALVYHKLGAERMSLSYFRKQRHALGYYKAYLLPWRPVHLFTVMPVTWYGQLGKALVGWMSALLVRRPWVERFQRELWVRQCLSVWRHRLQLWLRWWGAILMGWTHIQ